MNALDVGACTWLPDASSRWPGRGENKAHGCFDRVTKSTKTREQKKKESFPDCTRYQTNRATETPHTLRLIWELSPRIRLLIKYQQQSFQKWGSWKKKKKEMKEKRKTFPLCGKESCYYWGFPAWRVLFIGGFAWMCCSWRVGVNMCLSVGLQTSSSASIQECLGLYQGTIIQEN